MCSTVPSSNTGFSDLMGSINSVAKESAVLSLSKSGMKGSVLCLPRYVTEKAVSVKTLMVPLLPSLAIKSVLSLCKQNEGREAYC